MNTSSPMVDESEDVDAVWRSYFRNEMPNPWPAAPRPEPVQRNVPPLQGWHSRLALAASVAVMLFVCWLLAAPARTTPPNPVEDPASLNDATASPSSDIHSPDGMVVPMDTDLGSLE